MEDRMSKFNAGALKMVRLDAVFSLLNEINSNLKAYNEEYFKWNYELKLSKVDVLYNETHSKMREEEQNEMNALREYIESFLDYKEIVKSVKDRDGKMRHIFNEENFKELRKLLDMYEKKARYFVDRYGMDVAYKELEDEDEY